MINIRPPSSFWGDISDIDSTRCRLVFVIWGQIKSDLRTHALMYVSHWFKSKLSDRTYVEYTANYTHSDGSYDFPYLNKSQLQKPSTYTNLKKPMYV